MNQQRSVLLGILLASCAALGDEAALPREDTVAEAQLVAELYAQAGQTLTDIQQIRIHFGAYLACREPRQTLFAAIALSKPARAPGDNQLALRLLRACLSRPSGTLLRGYIQDQLASLEREERHRAELQFLTQKLVTERHNETEPQARLKSLENERIQFLQARIKSLEREIRVLRKQIRELTAIEQRLNQEGQKETP